MFLDLVVPDVFWLSLTVPGLTGLVCLLCLKVLSSLHGGLVVRPGQQGGTLFHCWLLTYWLVRETEDQVNSDCDNNNSSHENHVLLDHIRIY